MAVTMICTKVTPPMTITAQASSARLITWSLEAIQTNGSGKLYSPTSTTSGSNYVQAEWSPFPSAASFRVIASDADGGVSESIPYGTCN